LRTRRLIICQSGASAVIVAIVVVVMFGFTALAVDVMRMYEERRQLQRTADVSALSGAQDLLISEAAAEATGQFYVGQNPTVHHPGGYNAAGISNSDLVDAIMTPHTDPECTIDGIAYPCVKSRVVAPARDATYKQGFEFLFAKVLGFDKRPISAKAVAVVGAGAPGGRKLVPWMVLDCPNPLKYPDETFAVYQQTQFINPNCQWDTTNNKYGYKINEDWDNPVRVDLFLGAQGGQTGYQGPGNFNGIRFQKVPTCPAYYDGLHGKGTGTGGGDSYREFLGGGFVTGGKIPCTIDAGARAYSEDGVKVGPTSQGLADRGVSSCTNKTAYEATVDHGASTTDGVVSLKQGAESNPCLIVLLLTVSPDPAQSSEWDQDIEGYNRIAEWQDPNPLDDPSTNRIDGRFGEFGPGNKAELVREFGLFYLTDMGDSQNPYRGLFMKTVSSRDNALGKRPCEPTTAICVVKLAN
jgi:Putative Flp pilus-assembly TadE/G-like